MHTWFHAQLDQKICDGLYYISNKQNNRFETEAKKNETPWLVQLVL